MILEILFAISVLANVVLVALLYRLVRRAFQYDEVFQYIAGDIETNLKQFARIARSPLLGGEPEITQAHTNMMMMAKRLDEISRRMEETSGLKLRTPPPPPRPKVV